jgi:acyl dehydratase
MVNTDQQPSATITMDKNKIHADEQKAKDTVQGFGQEAKDKLGDRAGKGKEPEPRP